jgi:hypothetical protein
MAILESCCPDVNPFEKRGQKAIFPLHGAAQMLGIATASLMKNVPHSFQGGVEAVREGA